MDITETIKCNINFEYINKFTIEKLAEEKFIPFVKKGGILYVGIVGIEDKERLFAILKEVIVSLKVRPKVVALTDEEFDFLINYCKKNINSVDDVSEVTIPIKNLKHDVQEFKIEQDFHKDELIKPESNNKNKPKKKLGEILIEEGLITEEQLETALKENKATKVPIGSVLVKQGILSIEQLREALSKQQGFSFVETTDLKIDPNVIGILPEDFIKDKKVVPISTDNRTIVVGMVNPNDKQVLNDIIYLCGLKPFPLILTHIEFEKCIENFFKTTKDTEKLMLEISEDDEFEITESNIWREVEQELQEDSNVVAKFANSIVTEAIEKNASDIHVEPHDDKYSIRYRIDGILVKALDVPKKIEAQLISRFKVISRMDISEHRRPQDGSFSLKYNDKVYNLRLNTLPVGNQEKIVIRILRPNTTLNKNQDNIELIGATEEDIDKINRIITAPHGIILVTGPTGSGKTTTLYSILNKVSNDMVNITTVEDPVEIKLEGINQVQVNPKADITFASCMRAILRQDPDIIMIGEIRDFETLETAIHASLTGHLVLSTIHTNSATSTITRLIEMGAAPYLIASSLIGVVSQRLLRKLCPSCKELYEPTEEELRLIIPNPEDFDEFNHLYKSVGCPACGNSGFVGRMGIYEIMPVSRELKKMITTTTVTYEMDELAISCGMKTLQRAALDALQSGMTSIPEYIRVLGAIAD